MATGAKTHMRHTHTQVGCSGPDVRHGSSNNVESGSAYKNLIQNPIDICNK